MIRWLRDWGWVVCVAAVALGVTIMQRLRRQPGPKWKERVQTEVAVLRAAQDARLVKAELGAKEALQHVRDKYAALRYDMHLDVDRRVKELAHDPEALARTLERLSRSRPARSPQSGEGSWPLL